QEEALGDAIFDFVGVGEGGVGIEADEISEIVDAGDVAIGDDRLDGVLVAVALFVALEGGTVDEALGCRRAQIDGEFAGVAGDGYAADLAGGVERVAVASGTKGRSAGNAEPIGEVNGDGHTRSEFGAGDGQGSVDEVVRTVHAVHKGIEAEIEGK